MRGTGFEPEQDGRSLRSRCVLQGSNPTLLSRSLPLVPRSMRGVGFEPTDPYGTAS